MTNPAQQFEDEPVVSPLGPPPEEAEVSPEEEEARQPLLTPPPQEEYPQQEQAEQQEAPPPPPVQQRVPRTQSLEGFKATLTGPASNLPHLFQRATAQQRPYQPPHRYEESRRYTTAREYLDDLMSQPESIDWKLQVHRYGPVLWEGKRVPCKMLFRTSVKPCDALREEIIVAYGGGDYRIAIVDAGGHTVPGKMSLTLSIPTEVEPPKFSMFEEPKGDQPMASAVVKEEDAFDDKEIAETEREIAKIEKQMKLDVARSRQEEAALRLEHGKLQRLSQQKQMNELMLEMNRPKKEDDKEVRELRDELRRLQEASDKKFEVLIAKFADKPDSSGALFKDAIMPMMAQMMAQQQAAMQSFLTAMMGNGKKDDDGKAMREMMIAIQQANTQLMGTIATAMAGKPDGSKETREMMVAMQQANTQLMGNMVTALAPKVGGEISEAQKLFHETQKQMMEMTVKAQSKENSQTSALMGTLLQAVLQPRQSEMTPETILRLIGEGRTQATEMFKMAQEYGRDDEQPQLPDADGYDARAGLLGNIGRVIYSGLKAVMAAAASKPELLEGVLRLVGTKTPSEADLVNAANRMALQQQQQQVGMQPQIGMQQAPQLPMPVQPQQMMGYPTAQMSQGPIMMRPGQRPLITPPPQQVAQAVAVTPQQIGMQPPPVQPPQVRPAQPQPVPVAGVAPAAPQQQQVVREMESAVSGIDTSDADSILKQADEIIKEEASAPAVGVRPALEGAPASQAAPAEAEEDDGTPEGRLRQAVTDAMADAIIDVTDRVNRHKWVIAAVDEWNGAFLDQLAAESNIDRRIQMIGASCNQQVWQKLMELLYTTDGGSQIAIFHKGIEELISEHKAQKAGQPAPNAAQN